MDLDQSYVWITTRRLKPGTREQFSQAWRPKAFPEGMLRAYECYSPDGNEVVGIAIWDSPESWDRFRRSEAEYRTTPGDGTIPDRGTLRPLHRTRAQDPQNLIGGLVHEGLDPFRT